MKANIINVIHHLQIAMEYIEDYLRETQPKTIGRQKFTEYKRRIDWIFTDLKTEPLFPEIVRNGLRKELQGDVFSNGDLKDKIALLNPDVREHLITLIEKILNGEQIEIVERSNSGAGN